MKENFNLESYITNGIENIVKRALKASLFNPKESIFMAKYALASKEASKIRKQAEENGEHIPPFLIASITSKCNLHCAGCYSRANHSCIDSEEVGQLSSEEWFKIFSEAKELGVGFILLAGGEPLMRKDIIEAASNIPNIIFPIFTNGTMINKEYIKIFDKHRNLVPILSLEGKRNSTDDRRGDGIYVLLESVMLLMKNKGILFGASVTVTTANIEEVTSYEFLDKLHSQGCKVVIYVEYVPVTTESIDLAPGDTERDILDKKLTEIRKKYDDLVFISFPGDEKASGGCLAAGRGFFHINSHGGAEPCPFSPYSDINVRDTSLREALNSKLFLRLKENDILTEAHSGGCILFDRKEKVEELLCSVKGEEAEK